MRSLIALPLLLAVTALPVQAQSQSEDHAEGHAESHTADHATMHHAQPTQAHPHEHSGSQTEDASPQASSHYQPPALTDADRAAAFPALHSRHDAGDPLVWMVQADRLEATQGSALAWDGRAWIGHDHGRLWLRSEGERAHGKTTASLDVLWGKPVDAWWDVLAGIRHEQAHGHTRDWIAFGIQGLAPYRFEVQATAFLGTGGRSMLEAEVEYELLLSNRLILQPRIEARVNGRDDAALGMGAGLAETSAGLRLRYEIRREIAPYIGYAWSRKHGRTADLTQAAGEPAQDHGWVAGLRFWF